MRIEQVDERDSSWENDDPRFRVYLFSGGPSSWAVDTYDVTNADVLDVVGWAQQRAGDECVFAVALVANDEGGRRGLTWLLGGDINGDTPALQGMLARRGRQVVVIDEPS